MHISNCEQKVDNINTLISHLLNEKDALFFKKTSVIRPTFKNQELSFVQLVSWLYTLYFESGKDSIKVIKNSMSGDSKTLYNHKSKIVGNLRTKLHHNLDRKSSRNFKIEKDCHTWIKSACNKNIPNDERDWELCSKKLLEEAETVLSVIIRELEEMTDSATQKEIFIFNWKASTGKCLPPHIYDEIISDCLDSVHQNDIDIVSYRQKYYESWNRHISLLDAEADYLSEATTIVESFVIKDFFLKLPITISALGDNFILSIDFIKDLLLVIYEYNLADYSEEELIGIIKDRLPKHSVDV